MNNNNILVPRNIKARKEKLRQDRIKLLSQDIIEGNLLIDESFECIPLELIKVKEIKGDVKLKNYIPSWLKDVKIEGYFWCNDNELTSLKGCPKYIGGTFYCSDNKLTSLDGCPKYIGENFYCYNNKVRLQLPNDVQLKGIFVN